jgi:hypothetical protein
MKFTATADYIYSWPVAVELPSRTEPGKKAIETFTGRFRMLGDKEALENSQAMRDAMLVSAGDFVTAQKEQIRKVLVGWDESTVLLDDGSKLAFSAEALDAYLTLAPFRDGVINAYAESFRKRPVEGN